MKNIGLYLIPLLVLAAMAVCLDQSHPGVIPFWQAGEEREAVEEVTDADSLKLESSSGPSRSVVDLIDDDYPDSAVDYSGEDAYEEPVTSYDDSRNNTVSSSSTTPQWRIVVASVQGQAQAESLLSRPQYQGMEAVYAPEVDSYRIVGSTHQNLGQAQQSLQELQARFPAAWISHF